MLFNSFEFLFFFGFVFSVYFVLPSAHRWRLLLVASYLFYMAWHPGYVVLILVSTLSAYTAALGMARLPDRDRRRFCLWGAIAINLGLLLVFKYLDFGIGVVNDLARLLGLGRELPFARLLLPVGISFYTFQTLSYLVDVYRDPARVERNPARFALFVNFFPQLVAGPIERSDTLLPQFERPARFSCQRVCNGTELVLWGLFKKTCVADLVATVVRTIFYSPADFNGTLLMGGAFLFCVQVYCDFSGYSDIAIGLARMLGIDLSINFRQPYTSISMAEFWHRWHITLGKWFRDYVYIPLGGSRAGLGRNMRNLMIVFLLSGLWHGAAWTFVVFGAIHGAWLSLETLTFRQLEKTKRGARILAKRPVMVFRWGLTQAVILVSFTIFVSRSLSDAVYVIANMFSFGPVQYVELATLGLPNFNLILLLWHVMVLIVSDVLLRFRPPWFERLASNGRARMIFCLWMAFSIALFGIFERIDFVYFQF